MPYAPSRPCSQPSCPRFASPNTSRCDQHAKTHRIQADNSRESSTKRGYNYRWQIASKSFLKMHPYCQCPTHLGKADAPLASVVDHIIPHKNDKVLFWSRANWQAMSKACHDSKTAAEDGGFGYQAGGDSRGSVASLPD
jgi:5-methylcytosine-specific restriction enzyme A